MATDKADMKADIGGGGVDRGESIYLMEPLTLTILLWEIGDIFLFP
jgi:hypothetical protein